MLSAKGSQFLARNFLGTIEYDVGLHQLAPEDVRDADRRLLSNLIREATSVGLPIEASPE